VQEALLKFVKDRQLLLILDNCEHLAHASAELAKALLQSGPQVKVLASSRESLHVVGETTYPLSALAVPDPKQELPVAALTHYEAVHLFSDRALAAQPVFRVNRENAAAIVDICYRLDGIPLALELAAARVRALSVETIAERLSDRFQLLTGGDATSLPRQQTLRACIDWSYDLLTESERALLGRLAVFAGGWTLQAAEAVGAGCEVDKPDVLDLLTRLVEKSLVEFDAEGARYRLLETVRQYARERLVEGSGEESVRERHRDYFLSLAEEAAAAHLTGDNLRHWGPLLQLESDNLRTALKWSIDEPTGAQAALRLCGALRSFWWRWGRAGEGRDWCDKALGRASSAEPTKALLEALIASGMMQYVIGDLTAATIAFERALALSRELRAATLEGVVLRYMATAIVSLGQTEAAQSMYHQSIAIHRRLGDLSPEATSLTCLATLYINDGKLAAAEAPLGRAIMLSQQLGDLELEAYNVSRLGLVAQYQNNYALANIQHERALAIARDLGIRELELEELRHLGEVAVGCGEFEKARVLFRESLALSRDQDSWFSIRECIDAIVALATTTKSFEVATKLSGAVERLRRTMDAPRFPIDQERFESNQAQCRAELEDGRYVSAIAAGSTLQPNDTIAAAMAWLEQG
jgi:non-specific serine/threonine protein kinase